MKLSALALDLVLFFRIGGAVTLYSVLNSVSLFLLGLTAWETQQFANKLRAARSEKDESMHRALKWRSERNFWISFFSLTLWLLLYRVRSLMNELQALKKTE